MDGRLLSAVCCSLFLILCSHVDFRIISSAAPVNPALRYAKRNCFITSQNVTHYVKEGDTVEIKCNVECIPYGDTPFYEWSFKNFSSGPAVDASKVYSNSANIVLDLNNTFDYESDSDSTALTVNQMEKDMEGTYNCSVSYRNAASPTLEAIGDPVVAIHKLVMMPGRADRIYSGASALLLAVILTALAT